MNVTRTGRLLIANPITTVLLAAGLFLDLRSLPTEIWQGGVSTCGRVYGHWFREQPYPPMIDSLSSFSEHVVRFHGSVTLVGVDSPASAELLALARDPSPDRGSLSLSAIGCGRGFWAITRIEEQVAIKTEFGAGFSSEERRIARELYVDRVIAPTWSSTPAWLAELRVHDLSNTKAVFRGYLHNALTLCGLLTLLLSLTWLARIPATARWLRARHRVRHELCPDCAYSRSGLAPGSACPECGHRQER